MMIGIIFFDPEAEEMRVLFNGDEALSVAMLRKYGMYPDDKCVRRGA